MAKYQHPTHIADWLRANGININHIPVDSDLTITTDVEGRRTVHYEELITDDDGRIISFGGETRTVPRSAPLTVEPPDWWQPHEKPTREQLAAAVERVRTLHVRNANTGDCEHCSERDYPDYAVPHPCPTVAALDGTPGTVLTTDRVLTAEEYEEIKTRWNREHGRGPAPCEQHPDAPRIAGMCGACTQYPTDMTPETRRV